MPHSHFPDLNSLKQKLSLQLEDLEPLRPQQKWYAKTAGLSALLSITWFVSMVSGIVFKPEGLAFILLFSFVLALILASILILPLVKRHKRYKNTIKRTIVASLARQLYTGPEVQYQADQAPDKKNLQKSGLLPYRYALYFGIFYAQWPHKNRQIHLANIEVEAWFNKNDKTPNRAFRGLFLSFALDQAPDFNLILLPKQTARLGSLAKTQQYHLKHLKEKRLTTYNQADFDQYFHLLAPQGAAVQDLISPDKAQALLALHRANPDMPFMLAFAQGHAHLLLPHDADNQTWDWDKPLIEQSLVHRIYQQHQLANQLAEVLMMDYPA